MGVGSAIVTVLGMNSIISVLSFFVSKGEPIKVVRKLGAK